MDRYCVTFMRKDARYGSLFGTEIRAISFEDCEIRLKDIEKKLNGLIFNCIIEGKFESEETWEELSIDDKIEIEKYTQTQLDNLDYLFMYHQRDILNHKEKAVLIEELEKRELYEMILDITN